MSDDENQERDRYHGSGADLFESLKQFVAKTGPSFCTYKDESQKVQKAKQIKTGKGSVTDNLKLLGHLHGLQENLAFKRKTLKEMLWKCTENKDFLAKDRRWNMTAPEKSDYVETMTRRIRNLCRCTHQAQGDTKMCAHGSWIDKLPWKQPAKEVKEVKKKEEASGSGIDHNATTYGFMKELLLPYRQRPGSNHKDTGLPIEVPNDCDQDACATATWPDGSTHEVPITYGELALLLRPGTTNPSVGALVNTETATTHHRVTVWQRVDRNLLMSIYEQAKQIRCVKMSLFAPIEDQHSQQLATHPAVVAALEVMIPLAKDYAAGIIERKNMTWEKNSRVTQYLQARIVSKKRISCKTTMKDDEPQPKKIVKQESPGKIVKAEKVELEHAKEEKEELESDVDEKCVKSEPSHEELADGAMNAMNLDQFVPNESDNDQTPRLVKEETQLVNTADAASSSTSLSAPAADFHDPPPAESVDDVLLRFFGNPWME